MTEQEAIECLSNIKNGDGELIDEFFYADDIMEALDAAIKALEKQIPKKPKYQKIEYGKHKWKRKRNGDIDDFAWDFQYCNGVVCEVCGDTYCVHCNPDYDDLEDCVTEYWFCTNCNQKVGYTFSHCARCNQKLDWSDEDE